VPDFSSLGKLLLIIGLVIAGLGLAMLLAAKIPWIGKLPGDLIWRGKNITVYFPLMTSLIVSLVLTIVLWFINRR
jgi:hypothetical protein